MLRVVVAIPTLGESPYLPGMMGPILADYGVDRVMIMDNTPGPQLVGQVFDIEAQWGSTYPKLRFEKVSGSVYNQWNTAMAWARTLYPPSDAVSLVLLNDDLELAYGSISHLGLRRYSGSWAILGASLAEKSLLYLAAGSREVWGTYRHGGLNGCAFAVDPRVVEPIPACFNWWYGDDHLVNATRAAGGRVGVLEEVAVVHHSSTTGNAHWDRLGPLVAQDRIEYVARWGDT